MGLWRFQFITGGLSVGLKRVGGVVDVVVVGLVVGVGRPVMFSILRVWFFA